MSKHFHFARLWLPLLAGLSLLLAWTATLAGAGPDSTLPVPAEVRQAVAAEGRAPVLILLALGEDGRAPAQAQIRRAQDTVLSHFRPGAFALQHRYRTLPALSGEITAAGLATLVAEEQIAAVQLDRPGGGHLGQSVPALQADTLHEAYGLTGAGVTVAVLDSGVDSDHPDIADDLVAQQCFTDRDCPPNDDSVGTSAEDEQGHGSNVASIITARGAVAGPGFAPDADIVAVRVLDHHNSGWVSDWVAGLDWVLANQPLLHVKIINMSLGTWALYPGNCDAQEPLLAYAIARLRAAGITIFASSGNQGATNALAAPACNSGVIAVGATYDGNLGREPDGESYADWFGTQWPDCYDPATSLQTITCFTNSGEMLDLLAPGARTTGAGLNGDRWTYVGTSQAAPTAAGIAALMLQADEHLDPATIETMLEASGTPLADPRNGRQIPAVNALAALRPLLPVAPVGVSLAGPERAATGVPIPFTATVFPLTSTQPLRYRWRARGQQEVIQSGSLSNTTFFTWPRAGTYTIAVTATNDGGQATGSRLITVKEVALSGITIRGNAETATGAPYRIQAMVQPPTASWPITYSWRTIGQPLQLHSGGTVDDALFTWTQPGQYTVALTATNGLSTITHTHAVSAAIIPPAGVTLAGPATGATGFPYTFTVALTPGLISQPLTYTWSASDYLPHTVSGGTQAGVRFIWEESGVKEVRVEVTNSGGSAGDLVQIEIGGRRRMLLPTLHKPLSAFGAGP